MTTESNEPAATPTPDGEPAGAVAVAEAPAPDAGETAAPEPEAQAPLRERYLVPFLLPLSVVAGVIFFVLNMSRIFLAAKGDDTAEVHRAVVVASVVTLGILVAATAMSNARRLRGSTLVLTTCALLGVVTLAGWLSVGAAEEKEEGGGLEGPVVAQREIESGNLYFDPTNPDPVPVGITQFAITNTGGDHTFVMENPQATVEGGKGQMSGQQTVDVKVQFPAAGDYTFFCDIPGHRDAGMEGAVTVDDTLEPEQVEGGEGEAPAEGA